MTRLGGGCRKYARSGGNICLAGRWGERGSWKNGDLLEVVLSMEIEDLWFAEIVVVVRSEEDRSTRVELE